MSEGAINLSAITADARKTADRIARSPRVQGSLSTSACSVRRCSTMPPDRTTSTSFAAAMAAAPGTVKLSSHGPNHAPTLQRGQVRYSSRCSTVGLIRIVAGL